MYIIQTKLCVCLGLGTVLEGLSLRDVAQERRGRGAVVVDLHTKEKNLHKSVLVYLLHIVTIWRAMLCHIQCYNIELCLEDIYIYIYHCREDL
jgi:hypothetical protein